LQIVNDKNECPKGAIAKVRKRLGSVDELVDVARMARFKADLLLDPRVYLKKPDQRDH